MLDGCAFCPRTADKSGGHIFSDWINLILSGKAVADRHHIKPETVPPDVRRAVSDALSGLVQ